MKTALTVFILTALVGTGCTTTTIDGEIPEVIDNDPVMVQVSSMARTAFEAGEIPRAVVMYRRALDRARAMDNNREIAGNAYNLAACLVALGDYDDASKLLGDAERAAVQSGGDAGPALLLLADIQSRQGDWKKAIDTINRLERLDVDSLTRGQAYVMRAGISCDRNNVVEAEAYLDRARGYLRKNKDSGLAGQISNVSGRIAMLNEDWNKAALAFDREAAWMQRSARLYEMAAALESAGENYTKAGDTEIASNRFFRSARSLMAQGYYLDALRVIERAVELQEDGTDSDDAAAVAELFEEIQNSVGTMTQVAPE